MMIEKTCNNNISKLLSVDFSTNSKVFHFSIKLPLNFMNDSRILFLRPNRPDDVADNKKVEQQFEVFNYFASLHPTLIIFNEAKNPL